MEEDGEFQLEHVFLCSLSIAARAGARAAAEAPSELSHHDARMRGSLHGSHLAPLPPDHRAHARTPLSCPPLPSHAPRLLRRGFQLRLKTWRLWLRVSLLASQAHGPGSRRRVRLRLRLRLRLRKRTPPCQSRRLLSIHSLPLSGQKRRLAISPVPPGSLPPPSDTVPVTAPPPSESGLPSQDSEVPSGNPCGSVLLTQD
eukprot:762665-Rhodomonas_salina.3